jgi:hypothetical protein
MSRRHTAAAVLLGSAAVFLVTACGPSDSNSGAPANDSTDPAVPAAGTSDNPAGASSPGTRVPTAPTGTPNATAEPSATDSTGTDGGGKPCALPAGFDHFFKLDSAETYQGRTVVRVAPETCTVDPANDEDVTYTAVQAAQSFTIGSAASVKVLDDYSTTPHAASPSWLVSHHLSGDAQFYCSLDDQNRITAMEQIYHP